MLVATFRLKGDGYKITVSRYPDIRIRVNAASDFASFPNVFLIRRARKRFAMKPSLVV